MSFPRPFSVTEIEGRCECGREMCGCDDCDAAPFCSRCDDCDVNEEERRCAPCGKKNWERLNKEWAWLAPVVAQHVEACRSLDIPTDSGDAEVMEAARRFK